MTLDDVGGPMFIVDGSIPYTGNSDLANMEKGGAVAACMPACLHRSLLLSRPSGSCHLDCPSMMDCNLEGNGSSNRPFPS